MNIKNVDLIDFDNLVCPNLKIFKFKWCGINLLKLNIPEDAKIKIEIHKYNCAPECIEEYNLERAYSLKLRGNDETFLRPYNLSNMGCIKVICKNVNDNVLFPITIKKVICCHSQASDIPEGVEDLKIHIYNLKEIRKIYNLPKSLKRLKICFRLFTNTSVSKVDINGELTYINRFNLEKFDFDITNPSDVIYQIEGLLQDRILQETKDLRKVE